MADNQRQTELASYIGKLLRDSFGKGPESIFVTIEKSVVTIYLRNFMSPMEKALLDQDQVGIFQKTRDSLMKTLIPEIKAYIKIVTGMEMSEFYYDWGLHNRSGIFIGIGADLDTENLWLSESYEGKEQVHQEIMRLSKQVEKAPAEIYSHRLNPRTLLLFRNDILVNIEKELIRQGYAEILRITKRTLEKTYLHNNNHFESILDTSVIDIFVDWDFDKNKSAIVFITKPPT
ncbi:Na-translocating system protein MpsC family protein [Lentibacillus sp. Marseille-P4043]|uniref:Na-translocating system protein MpsC family protein n=1 Tax=Lentibacillus sp. Marseille-P4043 TaxID=2040293 RepID=UPI000D0B027B|nr:Na-translocating system protein MpsC family protein [Lentibacillus sp. Marseille-P4043]